MHRIFTFLIAKVIHSPTFWFIFSFLDLNCLKTLNGHTNTVLCIVSSYFQSKPILISGKSFCHAFLRIFIRFKGSKPSRLGRRFWRKFTRGDGAFRRRYSFNSFQKVHFVLLFKLKSIRDAKLIVTVSSDKLLKLWKLKMHLENDKLSVKTLKVVSGIVAHSKDINCCHIAPNDAFIATGSMDKTVKIFTLPNLTLQATLQGHKRGVWSVEFSQTEKILLSSSADTTIKMWSLPTASCLRTFEGHSGSVFKALFLSQSRQVTHALNSLSQMRV